MSRTSKQVAATSVIAPHHIESEQGVLGALMLVPEKLVEISDWLHESDFYRRDHQLIYRAIVWLQGKGRACDAVTLGEWFQAHKLAEQVGGIRYILELANSTPSAANLKAYAEIVLEYSRRRQLMDVASRLSERALTGGALSSAEVVSLAQQELSAVRTEAQALGLQPVRAFLKPFFDRLQELYYRQEKGSSSLEDTLLGVPTGWTDLDANMLGMQAGDLILLAGNPGMGKSVAGYQLAEFAAGFFARRQRPERVAVFSLEMTATAIVGRTVAQVGHVMHQSLRSGRVDDEDWPRITAAVTQLRNLPLLIDDQASVTVDQIAARAKREHARAPIGLLVVDHLHLVERDDDGSTEAAQIGKISRGLKILAKDLGCAVVALAQLNRKNTDRPNKRPAISDLRGSGSLEQDADVILFLHRDDYYDREASPGLVEMIVAKGREMRLMTVKLRNRFDQMRLENASADDYELWESAQPEPKRRPERGFVTNADRATGER